VRLKKPFSPNLLGISRKQQQGKESLIFRKEGGKNKRKTGSTYITKKEGKGKNQGGVFHAIPKPLPRILSFKVGGGVKDERDHAWKDEVKGCTKGQPLTPQLIINRSTD